MRLRSIGLVVGLSLLALGCGSDDDSGGAGAPVPAEAAQIEITFTGDQADFVGDREIVDGTVTVTFLNESDDLAIFTVLGYETGSAALADELEVVAEGASVITGDAPTEGYVEVEFEGFGDRVPPGSHTWKMDLEPGYTYLFDVGPKDFHVSGLWRAAVIEVVAE